MTKHAENEQNARFWMEERRQFSSPRLLLFEATMLIFGYNRSKTLCNNYNHANSPSSCSYLHEIYLD